MINKLFFLLALIPLLVLAPSLSVTGKVMAQDKNITSALLQGYRNLDNDATIQNLTTQRPETPLQLYPLVQKGAGDLRACFLPNHELNMTLCEHGDLYNDYKLCQKLLNTLGNCWGTEMLLWDKVHSLPLPTPPSPEQISKVVAQTGNLNNMTKAQEEQNATETKQLTCESLQNFVEWQKDHAYRQANNTILLVIPPTKHLMTAAQWAKGIDYYNNQCNGVTMHINP